jgi:hypothetical protein
MILNQLKKARMLILAASFAQMGCASMKLNHGMDLKEVNREFFIYCNKSDVRDPNNIVLHGRHPIDATVNIYRGNPSTLYKTSQMLFPDLCLKELYFKSGLLLSDVEVNALQESLRIQKSKMLDFISINNLRVVDKFANLEDDKFKIYQNQLNEYFYSINYKFVEKNNVLKEIDDYERRNKLEETSKLKAIQEDKIREDNRIRALKLLQQQEEQNKLKEQNLLNDVFRKGLTFAKESGIAYKLYSIKDQMTNKESQYAMQTFKNNQGQSAEVVIQCANKTFSIVFKINSLYVPTQIDLEWKRQIASGRLNIDGSLYNANFSLSQDDLYDFYLMKGWYINEFLVRNGILYHSYWENQRQKFMPIHSIMVELKTYKGGIVAKIPPYDSAINKVIHDCN